jgi:photosystem II stability/assembly factor-like uncharacterized protein
VAFAADGRGCAVGGSGVIVATDDAGTRWRTVPSPVTTALYDVSLDAEGPGWAVGAAGTVLRTEDAGATWSAQQPGVDTDTELNAVRTLGAERAVAVGGDAWGQGRAVVLTTVDAGRSWRAAHVNVWGELRDVAFSGALEGCAVGADFGPDGDRLSGVIVRTLDGGATWTQVAATPAALQAVVFVDALHGWAGGGDGALWRTSDGGLTWTESTPVTATDVYCLATADPTHLWLGGGGGAILFTAGAAQDEPAPVTALPATSGPTPARLRAARLRD